MLFFLPHSKKGVIDIEVYRHLVYGFDVCMSSTAMNHVFANRGASATCSHDQWTQLQNSTKVHKDPFYTPQLAGVMHKQWLYLYRIHLYRHWELLRVIHPHSSGSVEYQRWGWQHTFSYSRQEDGLVENTKLLERSQGFRVSGWTSVEKDSWTPGSITWREDCAEM